MLLYDLSFTDQILSGSTHSLDQIIKGISNFPKSNQIFARSTLNQNLIVNGGFNNNKKYKCRKKHSLDFSKLLSKEEEKKRIDEDIKN